uniref:SH3 domain-containing protein n=1 Tax=Macrostomum lignano TaxID=282301 RepID=A0A1I8ITU2_9PLAT
YDPPFQVDLEKKRSAVEAIQRAKEELSLKLLQSDPLEEHRKTLESNISTKKKDVAEAKANRTEADKIRAEISKVKSRILQEQQKQQKQTQKQPTVENAKPKQPDFGANLFGDSDDFFAPSSTSPWPPTATTGGGGGEEAAATAASENGFGWADSDWTSTGPTDSNNLGDMFSQQQQPQQKKPISTAGNAVSGHRSFEDEIEAEKSSQDRKNWEAFQAAFGGLKQAPAAAASEPVYDDIRTSYRALYDFTGSRHDEMSIQVGELIIASAAEQTGVEASWLFARCGSDRAGLVPRNYVAEEGTAEAAAAEAAAAAEPYDKLPNDAPQFQRRFHPVDTTKQRAPSLR